MFRQFPKSAERGDQAVSRRGGSARSGAVTLWVIVSLPAVAMAFVLMIDVVRIWVARVELKNALDAAVLSGVKTWAQGGSTLQARLDANDAFQANTILGSSANSLSTAEGGCANGNLSSTGELVLGELTEALAQFTFDCNATPTCGTDMFAVRARKTVSISSVSVSLAALTWGPYNVTGESYARYVCPGGSPQLFVNNVYNCTCP